jgi:hypothetical protein
MPNPLTKRIAFGTIGILVVLLLACAWYPTLSHRMIRRSDVAAPSLRALLASITQYELIYKTYPPTLSALGGAGSAANQSHAGLIDPVLASGRKGGYEYRYRAIDTPQSGRFDAFTLSAVPLAGLGAGQRHFFTDQTGVIRVEIGRSATAGSPPWDSAPD